MNMNGNAGKGDKLRQLFDYKKYWENWNEITKSQEPVKEGKKLKNGKTRYTYK